MLRVTQHNRQKVPSRTASRSRPNGTRVLLDRTPDHGLPAPALRQPRRAQPMLVYARQPLRSAYVHPSSRLNLQEAVHRTRRRARRPPPKRLPLPSIHFHLRRRQYQTPKAPRQPLLPLLSISPPAAPSKLEILMILWLLRRNPAILHNHRA